MNEGIEQTLPLAAEDISWLTGLDKGQMANAPGTAGALVILTLTDFFTRDVFENAGW